MAKSVFTLNAGTQETLNRQNAGQSCGFVFGAERTGLENDDIALCHAIINIPTNPDFSSLNLGQAVLLMAYEWFARSCATIEHVTHTEHSLPASQEHIEELWTRLESELDARKFFRDDGLKPTMIRNIRTMLTRTEMTDQEVRTFHGMISALIGNKLK